MKVSVVVPVFDEERTVCDVVARVAAVLAGIEQVRGDYEIVVVNDGSRDRTRQRLCAAYASAPRVRLLELPENRGKGAAVSRGIAASRGALVVIQDADLEYDPRDLPRLLQPLLAGQADVVFGSRFFGPPRRVARVPQYVGNRLITWFSNLLTNLRLGDVEVGYKAFRGELVRGLSLTSSRFGFEPEVTAKVACIPGVRIAEVGVAYSGRSYAEGKKVTWRDGFAALWWVLKYNVLVKRAAHQRPSFQAVALRQPAD